jgi:AraC family transcriptional regulator
MMDKDTKSTRAATLAQTRYVQQVHGAGTNSWIYEFWNHERLTKSWVGCGIEVGVQLRGEWTTRTWKSDFRTVGRGRILRVVPGERYEHMHDARTGGGVQVGFIVHGEDLASLEGDGVLRFEGDAGWCDDELLEFCEDWHRGFQRGDVFSSDSLREAALAYITRHAELEKATPLRIAKRELERYFDCDLSMAHITDVAGIHPETFARQFRATFGVTPANYRVLLRLNYASRLCWSRPDLSIHEISEECGFRNRAYFHRAFTKAFQMTPHAARQRFQSAAA